MRRIGAIALAGIVALAIAFLMGFWPQRQQLASARTEIQTLQTRVNAATPGSTICRGPGSWNAPPA